MTNEPTIQQLFDLTGKTALVTGGTGYLGRALTRAACRGRGHVIVTSRDQELDKRPRPNYRSRRARHTGLRLDHMETDRLAEDFATAAAHSGSIDVLVNNGHEQTASDLTSCTGEEFTRQLANATGYFCWPDSFEITRLRRRVHGEHCDAWLDVRTCRFLS